MDKRYQDPYHKCHNDYVYQIYHITTATHIQVCVTKTQNVTGLIVINLSLSLDLDLISKQASTIDPGTTK
ncbi:hypothetical protein DERF_014837 [Dermatophagoides farinae]|uniref:Uncharacterized protein n=1 Tax=Dermatophagoides farinae TaxID=6954 RepID=A0A922KV65_DERFA|nr:hypothetical protein DERF_014837 [Dermatophagoides farinae]